MPNPPRPSPLTMPIVTVCPTPNGLPTARTTSPTSSLSLSAIVIAGKFFPSTFSTAVSVAGSVPMILASNSFSPDASATFTLSAPSTTWLAVRM